MIDWVFSVLLHIESVDSPFSGISFQVIREIADVEPDELEEAMQ